MKIDRLKRILSNYDAVNDGTGGMPCVCVHGVPGTGKTALLDELKNSLLTSGANVYFSIGRYKDKKRLASKEPHIQRDDLAIRELLRQLSRLYGEKNDPDFMKFVVSYAKGTLATDFRDETPAPYTKDSLLKFIYGCLKTEPTVFIIDDLDRADAFTINLLGSLLGIGALSFLVFSHSDKLTNKVLSDMLYRNTEKIKYVEMRDNDDIFGSGNAGIAEMKNSGSEGDAESEAPVLDEAVLVLSKPGNEKQLIRHYMKTAQQHMKQLEYENAAAAYTAALDACKKLGGNRHENTAMEIDLLLSLGEVQFLDKDFKASLDSFLRAFRASDTQAQASPSASAHDFSDKRAAASIKLADCYNKLGVPYKEREHIMLCEAFFCILEHRTHFYDLYKDFILKYLYVLADLGEGAIFREKLKQAYSVCLLDDKEFTCSLYCEEAFMCLENGKFEKAEELLFEAQGIARECSSPKYWDEATNSLAICSEQMGKPFLSTALWKDMAKTSQDPQKAAQAAINIALLTYGQDRNTERAVAGIKYGIDLLTIVGEIKTASDIIGNLKGTPLYEPFIQ